MAGGLEIERVGRLGRLRIFLDVARAGAGGVVVIAGLELRVGRHQQTFARPVGARIFLAEIGEFLGRVAGIAVGELGQALVVDLARRHDRLDLHLVASRRRTGSDRSENEEQPPSDAVKATISGARRAPESSRAQHALTSSTHPRRSAARPPVRRRLGGRIWRQERTAREYGAKTPEAQLSHPIRPAKNSVRAGGESRSGPAAGAPARADRRGAPSTIS